MKKKARFYLGFFICSGERVKTVFTCSRVFLSLICTNAGTRINTGFFVHSLISISQAVRGRTGQVTNAALGRRGLLRAANWKARAQVGWRQVKFSLKPFSKGLQGVGQRPTALRGVRDRRSCLPLLPKKGGRTSPSWGGTETAPGAICFAACAPFAAFFHRLRRVKVKAARRCLALCKPLKRLERNFSLSLSHPSAAPYTMRNKGWLNSTTWPLPTQISATVPSTSAGISFISFMASIMHRVSPFFTWSPTSTKGRASGLGAE